MKNTSIKKMSGFEHFSFALRRVASGGLLSVMLCSGLASAAAQGREAAKPAPKPLYRDPVHDGAADPSFVWDRAGRRWLMFYTNRRADLVTKDPKDVAWVHGTRVGIAQSLDGGATWSYLGVAKIPYGKPDYTFWAPDVLWAGGVYHMYVVVVPGIFHNWNAPRSIIDLTSMDLQHWMFRGALNLGSDRVIDPYVFEVSKGHWRMFYKDERDHSYIHYADSNDLLHWKPMGAAIKDRPSEGPIVFRWKGKIWLIVDAWHGLAVYHSADALHWTAQKDNLLSGAGEIPTDRSEGHHGDVVVKDGRAYLFYFVQQVGADRIAGNPISGHRSVIQVVELHEKDGALTADRNAPVYVNLNHASEAVGLRSN